MLYELKVVLYCKYVLGHDCTQHVHVLHTTSYLCSIVELIIAACKPSLFVKWQFKFDKGTALNITTSSYQLTLLGIVIMSNSAPFLPLQITIGI
jgi:hypothetical protein